MTTQATIQVVTYGTVPTSVIDLVRDDIADALNEMDFAGELPVAHISEGSIKTDDGSEMHACYTHEDRAVRIWWQGVGDHIIGLPDDVIREEIGIYFFAAHEAVHHVQWQRGHGEPTINDGTAAYYNHPLEVEAQTIAHNLAARRFGLCAAYPLP
jgi:hypothetical protein